MIQDNANADAGHGQCEEDPVGRTLQETIGCSHVTLRHVLGGQQLQLVHEEALQPHLRAHVRDTLSEWRALEDLTKSL